MLLSESAGRASIRVCRPCFCPSLRAVLLSESASRASVRVCGPCFCPSLRAVLLPESAGRAPACISGSSLFCDESVRSLLAELLPASAGLASPPAWSSQVESCSLVYASGNLEHFPLNKQKCSVVLFAPCEDCLHTCVSAYALLLLNVASSVSRVKNE